MATPTITMTGNLTADPELQFGMSGKARCTFTVAATDRRKNDDGEWEDGDKAFVRCTLWEEVAEAFSEAAEKGSTVTVHGRLVMREYEKDGQKRQSVECRVFDVAVGVTRNQRAKASKVQRQGGGGGGRNQSRGGGGGSRDSWDEDPWASAPSGGGGTTAASYDDEPPF